MESQQQQEAPGPSEESSAVTPQLQTQHALLQAQAGMTELAHTLLAVMRPELEAELERRRPVQPISAPTLTNPGFNHQVQLNVEVLNILQPLKAHQDPEVARLVQEAFVRLEERNTELAFVDKKGPSGFAALNQIQAIKKIAPTTDTSALLALTSIFQPQASNPRKRPAEQQPFRNRGSDNRQSGSRYSNDAIADLQEEVRRLRNSTRSFSRFGPQQQRSDECRNCHKRGHWANQCPERH